MAQLGGSVEIGLALNMVLGATEEVQDKVLATVEESVRTRKVGKPSVAHYLERFVTRGRGQTRQSALRLIGLWKLTEYRPLLQEVASRDDDKIIRGKALHIAANER